MLIVPYNAPMLLARYKNCLSLIARYVSRAILEYTLRIYKAKIDECTCGPINNHPRWMPEDLLGPMYICLKDTWVLLLFSYDRPINSMAVEGNDIWLGWCPSHDKLSS